MTIPLELQRASEDFEAFLADARDTAGLTTRNQTYTMVVGVLHAFRRRLAIADAIRFAGILPPVLRSVFVAEWDPEEALHPFGDRAAMTREVQNLRRNHNFAPDTAISDVAAALRKHVDGPSFDALLRTLPPGAADFWRP